MREELATLVAACSNAGRWGDHDELGTLNLITPAMRDGIFTRGVLLDVAAALHTASLTPDHVITGAELELTETAAGLRVQPGDAVIVNTGLAHRHVLRSDPR